MTMPPKLVIFDCDGVLVDSEAIANAVLHDILARHGAPLTLAQSEAEFTGKNRYAITAYMDSHGLSLPANWSDEFYDRSIAELSKHCQPIPHIQSALDALVAANIPFCVASNGIHPKMNATLTKTGLLPYFAGKMYSGYDVPNGKPAPDLFLHAAAQNQTDPADCLVIEDSASGCAAAAAANMPCLVYTPKPADPPHGAIPFASMADLPKLLHL
ncbi:HAD-IA family hydrolase [Amylibacter sp. IMCC11727]|uniref:HAD family hydrolase n=1 Tax=Amylibacter sp. IMCC11727 TaxID=3039851 RepID=UPI00244E392C|nr:HAD-IA family hydrolase [Amylibacter sp. IMCC11727]WGI23481.1 HAD-IA family hydrolase [Amylibacter sp. IMCC11727]